MDLKVRYIKGNENNVGDPYPSTLAKALEMLEIWEEAFTRTRRNRSTNDESEIVFVSNDGESADYQNTHNDGGRGRGGPGGDIGRNGGRGDRGGRGNGRYGGCGSYQHDERHNVNQDEDGDHEDGIFEQNDNDNTCLGRCG